MVHLTNTLTKLVIIWYDNKNGWSKYNSNNIQLKHIKENIIYFFTSWFQLHDFYPPKGWYLWYFTSFHTLVYLQDFMTQGTTALSRGIDILRIKLTCIKKTTHNQKYLSNINCNHMGSKTSTNWVCHLSPYNIKNYQIS